MGPWAHRKLFWPPPPCFPRPRLSHRTAGPPRAQKPHGLRAKPVSQVAVLVCSQVPRSDDPWVSSTKGQREGGGGGVLAARPGGGGGAARHPLLPCPPPLQTPWLARDSLLGGGGETVAK